MSEKLTSIGSGSNLSKEDSSVTSEKGRLSRISVKIKNAVKPAAFATLTALAGAGAIGSAGCAPDDTKAPEENIGTVKQALLTGWEAPTTPSFVTAEDHRNPFVDVNGSQVNVYYASKRPGSMSGSRDLYKVTGTDNGDNTITWGAPNAVPGANSDADEDAGIICKGKWYQIYGGFLEQCDWDGTNVSNCSYVGGDIITASSVENILCDDANNTLMAGAGYVLPQYPYNYLYKSVIPADSVSWDWQALSNCGDSNYSTGSAFSTGTELLVGTTWQATHGAADINFFTYNSATGCSGAPQDINTISGSAAINNANGQLSPFIDSTGRFWYTDSFGSLGQIKMAWPLAAAPFCGDDIKNGSEACDGPDLGGQDCASQGFQVGPGLACDAGCNFDTSACVPLVTCGNGTLEGAEQCDTGASNGVPCTPTYGNSCNYCSIGCNTVNVPMQQYCDDDIVNGPEQCDDGAALNGVPCTPVYGSGCSYCTHTCTTANVAVQQWCGDGTCQASNENSVSCAADCGGVGGGGAGGIGGVGGAPGGSGGAGGETPTGGTGGVGGAGGETPTGGSGGAGGEVVGGGGAGAGGNGTGGEVVGGGGAGGGVANCEASVTGSLNMVSCDDQEAVVKATGNGTIKYSDKTLTVNDVVSADGCTFTVTFPKRFALSDGDCGYILEEPPGSTVRYADVTYGATLGAEGSKKELIIPAELNPQKSEGVINIIGHKIDQSAHFIYKAEGCDVNNLPSCTPIAVNLPNTTRTNEIPEGTTLYIRTADGATSTDGASLLNTTNPPTTPGETGDEGGCSIANVNDGVNGTRGNLAPILLALGLGAGLARRKSFVGVEVRKA